MDYGEKSKVGEMKYVGVLKSRPCNSQLRRYDSRIWGLRHRCRQSGHYQKPFLSALWGKSLFGFISPFTLPALCRHEAVIFSINGHGSQTGPESSKWSPLTRETEKHFLWPKDRGGKDPWPQSLSSLYVCLCLRLCLCQPLSLLLGPKVDLDIGSVWQHEEVLKGQISNQSIRKGGF